MQEMIKQGKTKLAKHIITWIIKKNKGNRKIKTNK